MKKVITLHADEKLYKLLVDEAEKKMLSISALLRLIILEHFNNEKGNMS